MGLFERTKHLERLAREIADQNLRLLGSKDLVDAEETKRQVLELEAVLREYRLNLEEADARRQLAASRDRQAGERAAEWRGNAALARAKGLADLEGQAIQRAQVYERERDAAHGEAELQAATMARLQGEIAEVERRIAVLRALRLGAKPVVSGPSTPHTPATARIVVPPRDPLEEAFERLKGMPPRT